MKSQNEILEYMRASYQRFEHIYGVRRIGIFGSASRGEAGDSSDIDVLVEMDEPTFDRYMDLKFELESALGAPIDLVLADTIKERLRPIIEKEVIYA